MLKFIASAVLVAYSSAEVSPAFTLRDARQMERPLDHRKPSPDHVVGIEENPMDVPMLDSKEMEKMRSNLHVDPRPARPRPGPPALDAMQNSKHEPGFLQKLAPRVPLVPGQHSRPGFDRGLHGSFRRDDIEDHMTDTHRDVHDVHDLSSHLPTPGVQGHDGIVSPGGDPRPERPPPAPPAPGAMQKLKPGPGMIQKPSPLVPGLRSRPGLDRALHGNFQRGGNDDHHDDHHHDDHHQDHDDHRMARPGTIGMPTPVRPADVHTNIFKSKPSPAVFTGDVKPKPKAKPGVFMGDVKPKPKAKPAPAHSIGSSRAEVDQLSTIAQQQCEMDYVRMCSPQTSFLSSSFVNSIPMGMSPQNSRNPFMMDIFVLEEPASRKAPCGTRPTVVGDDDDYDDDDYDDNDDDDYYSVDDDYDDDDDRDDDYVDDDYSTVDPLIDVMQEFFGSLLGFGFQSSDSVYLSRSPVAVSSMSATRVLRANDELGLELGFGQDGDMCLLDNFSRLSSGCQESVADLQDAKDAFDMEEENGCHMMPVFMTFLFVALMVRFMRARRMKQRNDSLQTTLAAIHASPDLKAKVEAASGVPLPPTLPKCRMAEKPWYVRVLCVVGMFVVSFIIVVNAFLITGLIVSQFITTDNNDEVSPFLVLSILFLVLTLEIIAVKKLRSVVCAYLDSSNGGVTASSGTSTPRSGNNGGSTATLPQIFQRIRTVQISSLLPARFRAASPSDEAQYVPLMSEEDCCQDECTEMSSMHASAPPASTVSTIPVVITPVSYASPSVQSSISMF